VLGTLNIVILSIVIQEYNNKYYLNVRQKHSSSEIEALICVDGYCEIVSTYARKDEFINFYRSTQ